MNWTPEEALKKPEFLGPYFDMLFLLDRGYPQPSALSFVSNHYLLDKREKQILNRIAFSSNEVKQIIQTRIIDPKDLHSNEIYVDGYNQYITFISLTQQDPVVLCRDGCLRDIYSNLHPKKDLKTSFTSLAPFALTFSDLKASSIIFYLDKQWSYSKKHAEIINHTLEENKISGECVVVQNVDRILKKQQSGVIFSHDRIILMAVNMHFNYTNWLYNAMFESKYQKSKFLNFKHYNYSYRQSSKLINSYPLSSKT